MWELRYSNNEHENSEDDDDPAVWSKGTLEHFFSELLTFYSSKGVELFAEGVSVGEDEVFAEQDTENGSEWIERLGNIEAQNGVFTRADHRRVGVCGSFEER